ncbi:uncharacterized protein LOC135372371 [Ornithodoros turicata]|uniref:uncharacterized protein LOC135372371 n=1 Tax=Ornithodoros turicata TaxID=34597 RepID=UPI003138DE2B
MGVSNPWLGSTADGVKLPKLRIDSFSGELSQWQGFWDQFRVSIHENPKLSNVNKFKYLISLATGPAARAIEGLSLRDENYVTAVDILKARFGKTELLVSNHLDSLFDLPPVKSIDDIRSLRKFHEAVTVRIRNLQSLGVSRSQYSITIFRTILRKIPSPLELEYYCVNRTDSATASAATSTADDLSSLLDFLEKEIEFRERVRRPTASSKEDTADRRKTPLYPSAASLAASATAAVCVLCKSKEHSLEACTAPLSAADKRSLLRREGRCFLCGKQSHLSKDCRVCYRLRCQNCNRRHLTQLCLEGLSASSSNVAVTPDIVTTSPAPSSSAAVVQDIVTTMSSAPHAPKVQPEREILLQTAKVWVQGENGQRRLVRVLLDGGSQRSFIRKDISAKIGCTALRTEDLHIHTLGNVAPSRTTYRCVQVVLCSQFASPDRDPAVTIEALEYEQICSNKLPALNEDLSRQLKTMGLDIADEPTKAICDVSLLIGSDFYWKIVTGASVRLSEQLVAVETLFGWTLQGLSANASKQDGSIGVMQIGVQSGDTVIDIDSQLRAFWELEHMGIVHREESNPDDDTVLQRFRSSASFEDGDNKALAVQRLQAITKKLLRDESLLQEYDQTIREYLNNGHAERVTDPEVNSGPVYYMPHHAVIRRDRETTKVRIVFYASSKASGCVSLNEALALNVLELLLRFRTYPVALIADVEKAFLQIVLDKHDRDCLRFFWYASTPHVKEPLPPLETWRMTRVPFGARSSPFLLAATLRQHLHSAAGSHPETAPLLASNFYVDDLVVGADTVEHAASLYCEAKAILQEGGMKLVKWSTNDSTLQARFEADRVAPAKSAIMKKVLGLSWDTDSDEVLYSLKSFFEFLEKRSDTKRYVLQAVSRVYDPLGYIAPYVITAKILLQRLWLAKLSWDEKLPEELLHVWHKWCNEAHTLSRIRIPRRFIATMAFSTAAKTLHVFCDASTQAYGAVIYLVSCNSTGHAEATLVLAKTRVAPTKTTSLPRLELMGAILAARLSSFVTNAVSLREARVLFWTDSEITLHWIYGAPTTWKPFVAHRVAEIQSITSPDQWRHCPGRDNPADLLTRGTSCLHIADSPCWWNGPE